MSAAGGRPPAASKTRLGAAIAAARNVSGLNHKHFACEIGEDITDLAHIEYGRRAVSIRKAISYARALGLRDGYFVEPLLQDKLEAVNALTVVMVGTREVA